MEVQKAMKNLIYKFGSAIAALALTVTAFNVNSGCMFLMHQPKLPEGAEKLSKIN